MLLLVGANPPDYGQIDVAVCAARPLVPDYWIVNHRWADWFEGLAFICMSNGTPDFCGPLAPNYTLD